MSALKKFLVGAVEAATPTPVAKVVEAAKPVAKVEEKKYDLESAKKYLSYSVGPGLAAGALAAVMVPRHRWLGFLGGFVAGSNGYALVTDKLFGRARAVANLAAVGAGAAGSLAWKGHPVAGFALPYVGLSMATMGVKSKEA